MKPGGYDLNRSKNYLHCLGIIDGKVLGQHFFGGTGCAGIFPGADQATEHIDGRFTAVLDYRDGVDRQGAMPCTTVFVFEKLVEPVYKLRRDGVI